MKIEEKIADKAREVLHTYSMIGLLRGKSPVSWDEAYLKEWSQVLAGQISQLFEEEKQEIEKQERERILGLIKDPAHFTGADSPSGANVWFRMKDKDWQALKSRKGE